MCQKTNMQHPHIVDSNVVKLPILCSVISCTSKQYNIIILIFYLFILSMILPQVLNFSETVIKNKMKIQKILFSRRHNMILVTILLPHIGYIIL